MSKELGTIGRSLTLGECFRKMADDDCPIAARQLRDKTIIYIAHNGKWQARDKAFCSEDYDVTVVPPRYSQESRGSQTLRFVIGEEGNALRSISSPISTSVIDGDAAVSAGNSLTIWLCRIINKGKYYKPPSLIPVPTPTPASVK
jgi:hypothetical protein